MCWPYPDLQRQKRTHRRAVKKKVLHENARAAETFQTMSGLNMQLEKEVVYFLDKHAT